jgi:S1-C subfamily serine protease
MFVEACKRNRGAIYGLNGLSQVDATHVNGTSATGFMISPGILVTAAHFCHVDNDRTKALHQAFEAIRAPDIGQKMEVASFVAENKTRDIALLRIAAPRSKDCLKLVDAPVSVGTACGSLGFPLASLAFSPAGRTLNLVERFQSASISAFPSILGPDGQTYNHYETDSLMYRGSSGCPGFLADGRVFGMHVSAVIDQQSAGGKTSDGNRLAISNWASAADIAEFVLSNNVKL